MLRFKSIAFAFSLKTSYQLSHLISMTNLSFLAYQVGQRHLLPLSVQRQLPLKASLSQSMMVRSPHHLLAPLPLKASHLIFPQHSPPPPADPLPSLLADSPSPLLAKAERVGNYLLNALTYLRPTPCYSPLAVFVSVKQNVKLRIHRRRSDPLFFY